MNYYSKEYQDRCAHQLIGGRGTYLDLGSHHPFEGNNSAALEWLGWKGVSVDYQERWVKLFNESPRRNPCIQSDVTVSNFIIDLRNIIPTKHFNYISLDVDEASIPCLKLLISSGYTFDFMTFEHDIYNGEEESKYRKSESIKILHDAGYKMIFENVLTKGTEKYDKQGNSIWEPWEDWWVGERFFDKIKEQNKEINYDKTIWRI
tara:strand:- start:11385 stop:11999 length:615 start_codon:yes stop_codon:yes gene_type:complete